MLRSVVEDGPVHGSESTAVSLLQYTWPGVAGGREGGREGDHSVRVFMCGVWVFLTVEGAEDRQDSLEQLTSDMKCGPVCVSSNKTLKTQKNPRDGYHFVCSSD